MRVNQQTFLLTYNPAYWVWENRTADIGQVGRWNVGRRRDGVNIGDCVFVLQQGNGERGLIARGEVCSPVFQEPHFDGVRGHIAACVEVVWLEIFDSPVISTVELEFAVPQVHWRPRQSGALIPAQFSDEVLALWMDACAEM